MSQHGPLAGGTHWLASVAGTLTLVVASGCSGGGSPSIESAQVVATTVATSTAAAVTEPAPIGTTIDVRLVIDGKPTADSVDLATVEGADPFGAFASCSGLRTAFGAYQMLVSGSESLGGSVQVNSTSNPHDPGTTSASARIESASGPVDVEGTLDLSDDFRSGRFLGEAANGSRIVIEFDCRSPQQPAPLDRTHPYVDIALLMSKGNQRRVLSMGLATPCAATGIDSAVPTSEAPIGGLSRAVIAPDKLELFVGDHPLTLRESSVSATSSSAGTFDAVTADGATITGAYSCRG